MNGTWEARAARRTSTYSPTDIKHLAHCSSMGRCSSVGIGTGYGLECPGMESSWGARFSVPSRPSLGPALPPIQWVLVRSLA